MYTIEDIVMCLCDLIGLVVGHIDGVYGGYGVG